MNRIVVGASYGLKDWLAQRVTAVVMALYTLLLLIVIPMANGYEGWRTLMASGLMRFATFIFILSLCYHAWVGVRDIWMDYIKPTGVRLVLHVLTLLALIGYAGWAVQIIWRL